LPPKTKKQPDGVATKKAIKAFHVIAIRESRSLDGRANEIPENYGISQADVNGFFQHFSYR